MLSPGPSFLSQHSNIPATPPTLLQKSQAGGARTVDGFVTNISVISFESVTALARDALLMLSVCQESNR